MTYMKDEDWFPAAVESHKKLSGELLDPETTKVNLNHIDYELLPNIEKLHQLSVTVLAMTKKWQKAMQDVVNARHAPNAALRRVRKIEKETNRLMTEVRQEIMRLTEAK